MHINTATEPAGITAARLATEASREVCVHCGGVCRGSALRRHGQHFCCRGCLTVFELLQENGLGDFYRLAESPGVQVDQPSTRDRFAFLDEEAIRDRVLDFSDGHVARVTFHVPAIHCVACVWLLENLFKLRAGIGRSVVNFETQQVTITFETERLRLSELAALLTSIGYEPTLRLDSLERPVKRSVARSLHLKLGVAGFAFGNIMLFSICLYSGMDRFNAPLFKPLFGWVSLLLALPVIIYSASDYWRGAWVGLRQRMLTIDLPIALGLAALFGQSLVEVVAGRGVGFLDSLTGLVFFLLVGRVFQQKTYDRLSFDRDYRSFFPLAVTRRANETQQTVPVSDLAVGDHLTLRHGELIPADARVVQGRALVDYSFVTGESELVEKSEGDKVYAGGQQVGGAIEVETLRPVSQSYLTSLWSHEAFAKVRDRHLNALLNRFSRVFTLAVISIAVAAAAWWWSVDSGRALRAFTAVLIVACPCALALTAPFALGTAQRLLAQRNIFLKNSQVVEDLASVGVVVFDKTGTLTSAGSTDVQFCGEPLSGEEKRWVCATASQSAHPHSVRISNSLSLDGSRAPGSVARFEEVSGRGIAADCQGHRVQLGSLAWLSALGVAAPPEASGRVRVVHLAFDGRYRGYFQMDNQLRPEAEAMLRALASTHELSLLSGDNDRERGRFQSVFGQQAKIRFNQSPLDKLEFVDKLQQSGRKVMMVGDGLNDAGALRRSDVGVAVAENIGTFSPASDVILEGRRVPELANLLRFSHRVVNVVWAGILISLLYNVVGLTFAASGRLSPVICAILMPLSSISVAAFACGAVNWVARRTGLQNISEHERIPS